MPKRISKETKIDAFMIDTDKDWDLYEFQFLGNNYAGHVPRGSRTFNVEFVEKDTFREEEESLKTLKKDLDMLGIPYKELDVNRDSELIYIQIPLSYFNLVK